MKETNTKYYPGAEQKDNFVRERREALKRKKAASERKHSEESPVGDLQ